MSKKNPLVAHHEKLAGHHAGLSKGFTGLTDHFRKMAKAHATNDAEDLASHCEDASEHCKAMAEHHDGLSEAHSSMAEQCDKAIQDRMSKTVLPDGVNGGRASGVSPDAPEEARNRLVNRLGGAPIPENRRPTVPFSDNAGVKRLDLTGVPVELEDLVKASE